jgi:Protein of unknown function (DUF3592)
MIAKLFRPLPYPSVLLFAIIAGVMGIMGLRQSPTIDFTPARNTVFAVGVALIGASAYLVFCFARGVWLDLHVQRDGVAAYARITRIEERSRPTGYPRTWWLIHFTFQHVDGTMRDGTAEELDKSAAEKWKVGDSAPIKYDPAAPSIFRWLG